MQHLANNPVVPAPIPHSAEELVRILERSTFAAAIQIDVVDGIFAQPASWPYEPIGNVRDVAEAIVPFDIEVDLMVMDGIAAARAWNDIGVRRFIFHLEAIDDIESVVAFKSETGSVVGFSINNDTPLSTLIDVVEHCDFVQLMGIATIGSQGQPFDERVLLRTQQLRTDFPNLPIMIDGSVNEDTLPRLRDAGANRFAVGSAILTADNPGSIYARLTELALHTPN